MGVGYQDLRSWGWKCQEARGRGHRGNKEGGGGKVGSRKPTL